MSCSKSAGRKTRCWKKRSKGCRKFRRDIMLLSHKIPSRISPTTHNFPTFARITNTARKSLGEKADIQPRKKGGSTGGRCQELHKGPCTILPNTHSYTHTCTGRYTYIPIPAYTRTYRHMRIFYIYKLHAYICTHVDMGTHTSNLSFNLCSISC